MKSEFYEKSILLNLCKEFGRTLEDAVIRKDVETIKSELKKLYKIAIETENFELQKKLINIAMFLFLFDWIPHSVNIQISQNRRLDRELRYLYRLNKQKIIANTSSQLEWGRGETMMSDSILKNSRRWWFK
ncbi:MAG: hypothetical protein QXV61_00060 [Archaeoglobaceae archaeon]